MEPEAGDAARLAEQHAYITSALGFTIHPTIEATFRHPEHNLRIADVSIGYQFPKASDGEYPLRNCTIERVNIRDVVSSDGGESSLNGQFHLVAVRLLHTELKANEWNAAVTNLCALLRPGGWLQWVDWDPMTARIAGVKAGASDVAIRELFHRFTDLWKEQNTGTTYKIPTSLKAIAMGEEDSDMFALNPEVNFTRNIATGAIRALRASKSADSTEIDRLENQVDEEIKDGNPLLWYDLWCHIAKKPEPQ